MSAPSDFEEMREASRQRVEAVLSERDARQALLVSLEVLPPEMRPRPANEAEWEHLCEGIAADVVRAWEEDGRNRSPEICAEAERLVRRLRMAIVDGEGGGEQP
jgi:hypothetical protein